MNHTNKRLHREEQEARSAACLEPSSMGPLMGLAIGVGVTFAGLAAITLVISYIGWVVS